MSDNIFCLKNSEQLIIDNHINIKYETHIEKDYKNIVCKKPWGYEFLVFKNNKIGIWFLKIKKGHKTSLHCHFNKDTIIVGIKGSSRIELINNNVVNLDVMKCLFLPHYNFHSLGSYSDESYILEIEIFNNNTNFSDKNDLLRIDDTYKRKDNVYETSINEIKENLEEFNHFYLENDFEKKINDVDFKLTEIKKIDDINIFEKLQKYNFNILIQGSIFQNFKYYKEGSIIDNFENIQFLDDKITLLSLKKYDFKDDSKIIYNNEHLNYIVKDLKNKNKRIILSSGCFDIIHIGHIHNLIEAKQMGDILMICLSSDEQIQQLKGSDRPINNYKDRINLFKTLPYVDYIILYNELNIEQEETLDEIMKVVDPYIWVKGSDYDINNILIKHPHLKKIKLIDNIENKSTTNIITKIKSTIINNKISMNI